LHAHYEPTFRNNDPEVKEGLYICMRRLVSDVTKSKKKSICNFLSFTTLEDFFYGRCKGLLDIYTPYRMVGDVWG